MGRFPSPFIFVISGLLASCVSTQSNKAQPTASEMRRDKERDSSEKESGAHLLETANQYARDGLYREAITAFNQYLEKHPEDGAANRTLGILYVKSGAYKKATQYLDKAFAIYPNNYELNFYLGEAMRMQSRYADAIYHYQRALEADPKNTGTLKALAWAYYNIRYYSEAIHTAKQLKQLAPNDFQVAIITARILNKISMNDKALALLNRTETFANADSIPFLNSVKGDILLSMGEKDAAEQAYRKALQDQPLLPGALIGLAKKFIEDKDKKNNETAVVYLERALKIRPNLFEAYYLLGKAYQKSNPLKSLEYYKMFAKEASYDPSYQHELAEIRPQLMEARKASNANKRSDATGSTGKPDVEEQF
ncbi:MAG: tetratricopeptide repeat protein [Chitinophagaceae bacterium]|nr:tetratricopeptide repeat protein [Oligoflexus sp.]